MGVVSRYCLAIMLLIILLSQGTLNAIQVVTFLVASAIFVLLGFQYKEDA